MKDLSWVGSSLNDLRDFPEDARSQAGYQIRKVQAHADPDDAKPLFEAVGSGAYEIRIEISGSNEFRVIYVAKFNDAVYVLHCFQKKERKTSKSDLDLAKDRYKEVVREINRLKALELKIQRRGGNK